MEGHLVLRGKERARKAVMVQGHLRLECRIMCLPPLFSILPSVSAGRLQSTLILWKVWGVVFAPITKRPTHTKRPIHFNRGSRHRGPRECHNSVEMSYIFSREATLVRAEGQSNTGDPSPHSARNLQRLLTARSPAGRVPRSRCMAR